MEPPHPPRNLRGGRILRPDRSSRFDQSPVLLSLPVFLLLTFIPRSYAVFNPADNYLVNCGATTKAALSDGSDIRQFLPDDKPSSFSLSPDGSSALANSDGSVPALYRTARSFSRSFSYRFPITNTTSTLAVRLHFYPTANLSTSTFSVSASDFPLLLRFRPTSDSFPIIKEFFLKPNLDSLTISFSPDPPSTLAFVNAIEVFSAPSALIPSAAQQLTGASAQTFPNLDAQVLETLHRVNIGGVKVTPNNDTLWRTWLPDDATGVYVTKSPTAATKTGSVQYSDGGPTVEVAPNAVYGSARAMYAPSPSATGVNGTAPLRFNLTWVVSVDSSQKQILVRMHYCDIVSSALNEFLLNSYINNQMASRDLDISTKAFNLASPYYEDFVVGSDPSGNLTVSVGPSDSPRSKVNAFLNGLEVFAMKGAGQYSDSGGSKKKGVSAGIIIAVAVGVVVIVGVVAGIAFLLWRRNRDKVKKPTTIPPASFPTASWPSITDGTDKGSRFTDRSDGTPLHINFELRIPYDIILAATKSFDKEAEIGSGGFGKVYKGKLADGRVVAVKRGKPGSQHGPQQFQSEILILSKTRHRHLVSFIGYCEERGEMILVYEFMEKGTLQSHLYGSSIHLNPCLSWKQRLQILIGAAQGLDYLHTGQEPGIIHRDVKSANILLDGNYLAKVADFGISKLGPPSNSAASSANNTGTSVVKGTFGYLDPEYFRTQQLTNKSDVYSFGVVLLEVACARAALVKTLPDEEVSLAEWGLKWIKLGMFIQIVDPRISDEIDPNSLRAFSAIAEKCLASHGEDRPTMNDVLWNLNYALNLQESSSRSESHEDSVVGSSVANVSIVQPFLVANTQRVQGNGTRVNTSSQGTDLSSSTTDVFSQLITKEGR